MSTELATALASLGVTVPSATGGGGGEIAWTPPTTATFGTFRSGSSASGAIANLSNSRGVRLTANAPNANVNSLTYAHVPYTVGATGKMVATARLRRHVGLINWAMTGMSYRNSTSGKSRCIWTGSDSLVGFNVNNFLTDDAWAAVAGMLTFPDLNWWQRIRGDGTNFYHEISMDGEFWTTIGQEGIAASYTGVPTHVGIAMNPNTGTLIGTNPFAMDCLSWSYTTS